MIKISKRLVSLVKYIDKDDKPMDVGCDHAKLDIYLVENSLIDKIYVSDVNPNALENGKRNIEEHKLNDKVLPILSYGIEKLGELDVDTLIISGMGSKNIIDIISSPNLNKVYKLILQSNNNHSDLRRYLVERGFVIAEEEIVEDGKTYINIIALRTFDRIKYDEKDYEFGPLLIKNKDNLNYFIELKKSYEDLYQKNLSEETKAKINILEEIIRDLS